MTLGTGVPDDCRLDLGTRVVTMKDALFRELGLPGLHPQVMRTTTVRVKILPAHGAGLVYSIFLEWEGMDGPRMRRFFALPETSFLTERGNVRADDLTVDDMLLPDYTRVTNIYPLFVQADFCRAVSLYPMYVDVGGMYIMTCQDRKQV